MDSFFADASKSSLCSGFASLRLALKCEGEGVELG